MGSGGGSVGRGRVWLLVRGLARERRHWHEFPRLLAERDGSDAVELVDLPGAGAEHGRVPLPSVAWMARDVARRLPPAVTRASAGAVSLVGLSLGGMVALELCRLLSGRFSRAVIINASSRLTPPLARLRPCAALGLVRAGLSGDPTLREQQVLELTSTLPAAERARYAGLAAGFAQDAPVARRTQLSQLLAAARFRPPAPATLGTKLLFLCSENDGLVSPRCSRELAAFYGARYEQHASAGHDLPLDDPAWLCERLVTFASGPS
jgi:pimeloyl-ACP methyl ester carboxylesterase